MPITFSADEVFEMAEQIERNGAKFYRKAAQGISDSAIKKVLEELAVMEDDHRQTFSVMRYELSRGEQPHMYDPDNQAELYLRAMADGEVFDLKADPSEKLTGRESPIEIFQTALGLEKDSIVFYLGLEEMVPPKAGQDKIRNIIREEMNHITILTKRINALKQ